MPELPDIELYLSALRERTLGRRLRAVRLMSPFLLRSVKPPLAETHGLRVIELRRLGKRIVFGLENKLFLVLHLMIAGRLRWRPPGAKLARRMGLAAFDFTDGTLVLTEAGSKKRASLFVVANENGLCEHDRGGLEVLTAGREEFQGALLGARHTLKRALTDPGILSGIGNAYSDEILHSARLSPFKLTDRLSEDELERLYGATRDTLERWRDRLEEQRAGGFPDKVTAFRPEMAVHGRYGKPCPECESPVQRIVYAQNEANYCAACQTGGRLLADRALSRLLRDDWPRTLEELEERRAGGRPGSPGPATS